MTDAVTDESRVREFLADPGWQFLPTRNLLPSVLGEVRQRRRRRVAAIMASSATALVLAVAGGAETYSVALGLQSGSSGTAAPAATATRNASAKQALITALTERWQSAPYEGGADRFDVRIVASSATVVSFTGRYRVWSHAVTEPGYQTKPIRPTAVLVFKASTTRAGHSP